MNVWILVVVLFSTPNGFPHFESADMFATEAACVKFLKTQNRPNTTAMCVQVPSPNLGQ